MPSNDTRSARIHTEVSKAGKEWTVLELEAAWEYTDAYLANKDADVPTPLRQDQAAMIRQIVDNA